MTKISQLALNLYIAIFIAVYMPFPMPGQIGAYNPNSHLYVCFDAATCIHEQGHKLDQSLGWPSQSEEYQQAVTDYIVDEFSGTPSDHAIHSMNILLTRKSYTELYADVWMWAGGNTEKIPATLRGYYG